MDAALSSLLGAVIGGGLVSGSNLLLDRARARRETRTRQADADMELRQAARLVNDELGHAERLVSNALSRKALGWEWDPPRRPLPRTAWSGYRTALAAHGDDETWMYVAEAYALLELVDQQIVDSAEEDRIIGVPDQHPLEPRKLGSVVLRRIENAHSLIEKAQERLRPVMGHRAPSTARITDSERQG